MHPTVSKIVRRTDNTPYMLPATGRVMLGVVSGTATIWMPDETSVEVPAGYVSGFLAADVFPQIDGSAECSLIIEEYN